MFLMSIDIPINWFTTTIYLLFNIIFSFFITPRQEGSGTYLTVVEGIRPPSSGHVLRFQNPLLS